MRNRAGFIKGKNGKLFSNKEIIAISAPQEKPKQTTQMSNAAQEKREEIRRYHMEQERIRQEQIEQERFCFEQKRLLLEQAEKKRKEAAMIQAEKLSPADSQLVNSGIKITFRPTNESKILPQKKHITYEEMLLFMHKTNPENSPLYAEMKKFCEEKTAYLSTMVPVIYMHLIAMSVCGFAYCDFLSKPRYDCVGVYFSRKFADKMVSAEAYETLFPAILPYFRENCCIRPEFNAESYENWLRGFMNTADLAEGFPAANPQSSAVSAFFCKFPRFPVLQKKTITNFVFVNNSIFNGSSLNNVNCYNANWNNVNCNNVNCNNANWNNANYNTSTTHDQYTNDAKSGQKSQIPSVFEQKMQINYPTVHQCDGFEITTLGREFSTDFCNCYALGGDTKLDAKYLFILPHGGICIESIIRADRCIENMIKKSVELLAGSDREKMYQFTFPLFSYTNTTNQTEYIINWIQQLSRDFPAEAKKYFTTISGHINNTAASFTHVYFDLFSLFCVDNEQENQNNNKVVVNQIVSFNRPFLLVQLAKNNQLVSIMKIGSAKNTEKISENSDEDFQRDDNDDKNDKNDKNNKNDKNDKKNTTSSLRGSEKQKHEQIYIVDDL